MPGLVFLLLCTKVATEEPIAFRRRMRKLVSVEKNTGQLIPESVGWQICILNELCSFV